MTLKATTFDKLAPGYAMLFFSYFSHEFLLQSTLQHQVLSFDPHTFTHVHMFTVHV